MKMMLKTSFALVAWAAVVAPTGCDAANMTGYLIDKLCNTICANTPEDQTCAPDQTNTHYHPNEHTGWCLLLDACVASGYDLVSEEPGPDGKHTKILDLTGSQDAILAYIEAGSHFSFPMVVVEYDEALAMNVQGGLTNAVNATVRDAWSDGTRYTGADTHQVLCEEADAAAISTNNLCFRSDVSVREKDTVYVVESNGCPDHASMQGSRGVIANPQGDFDTDLGGTEAGGGGCCAGGCCADSCSSGCCASSCSAATCAADSCSGGGGWVSGCNASDSCVGGCNATVCCAGGCKAGCCAGACCAGDCSGDKYSCCDGMSEHTPKFQHYTMMIPKDPGIPGEGKTLKTLAGKKDDVIGILTNGVLLDNHQQTWAYDNCNGHSDKKGQYHYHIPGVCVMEAHGVPFASGEDWWLNDDLTEVRAYSDMASQFPATGTPSPVIGFARDGFPIYGLYDSEGKLQHGEEFGGDLDECNGKMVDGKYGYFITPDPPFAPPCLKGSKIGSFAYASSDIQCPTAGIQNTVLSPADVTACQSATASLRSGLVFSTLGDCKPLPVTVESPSSANTHLTTATMRVTAGVVTMAALLH